MSEMFTQLPTVANAQLTDIICAVQGYVSPANPGVSVQETLAQVFSLVQENMVLSYAGNPNGHVAGELYQFCYDTVSGLLYICTTAGTASSAVWMQVSGFSGIVAPSGGGTGVANPTAHTIPIAEGSANYNFLGPLTNGQILIGSTASDPVPATLMAGTNISIVNGEGGITISSTGSGGFTWTHVTGSTQAMFSNSGYVIDDSSSLVTLTLPITSNLGDEIIIMGRSADLWKVTYGTGQYIIVGSVTSTLTSGYIASTNAGDSITLICTEANIEWTARSLISAGITIV